MTTLHQLKQEYGMLSVNISGKTLQCITASPLVGKHLAVCQAA
ncbi:MULTISPECIES: hypothetical protein [Mycetohabitans]|nr:MULTISPECIES: hypothetical protein [unclassified Mycetohabitans]